MEWGSCVLRVVGAEFEPNTFLNEATLEPYQIIRRGEPVAGTKPDAGRSYEQSGFGCDVSSAGRLTKQVEDAIEFLRRHEGDLVRLKADASVEHRRLDFGYQCRLGENVCVQGEHLPVELLRLCGTHEIGIDLSLYPPMRRPPEVTEATP